MTQTWFHDKATEIFQNKNDSHFLSVRLCKYMMYMIWDIFLDIVQQKLSRICIEKKIMSIFTTRQKNLQSHMLDKAVF